MSRTGTQRAGTGIAGRAYRIGTALWMTAGHGPRVRAVADATELTAADRVVDVGCGPGTAVRLAGRRAATATGIDPDPAMLRFAHWGTAIPRPPNISWLEGRAEKLPLPDGQATVVWAISSAHHWEDRDAGISEARRVLAPAGRLVLAERLTKPAARRHAAHGLTRDQAEDLARQLTAAGFGQVRLHIGKAGLQTVIIIRGQKDPAAPARNPAEQLPGDARQAPKAPASPGMRAAAVSLGPHGAAPAEHLSGTVPGLHSQLGMAGALAWGARPAVRGHRTARSA